MLCPYCGYIDSKVINSRQSPKGDAIRRRRECLKCAQRFTTFEVIEKVPVLVIKRDGSRATFDRQKVVQGVLRACEKRPVTMEQVERVVQSVEKMVYNSMEREISSLKIGEQVLRQLRELDEVAYVRFASVYRKFHDVSEFSQVVSNLTQEEAARELTG